MSSGGLMLATTALSAVNSIGQGYGERAEQNYNASVSESQRAVIQAQQEIEYGQYQRLKGRTTSTSMANIAKAGIMPGGSAAAAMVNTIKNITIDQAIGQFNYEAEKSLKQSEADAYRRKGSLALRRGWSEALSTSVAGATNFALYKGFNLNAGAGSAS